MTGMLLGTFQYYFVPYADSQILILPALGPTSLSDLFVVAWNAYFTAFFHLHSSSKLPERNETSSLTLAACT